MVLRYCRTQSSSLVSLGNWGREYGRQVTWNNSCGVGGGFDTPEFNLNATDEQYMSGEEIVVELVSIVANNGYYLHNIGPKKDGSIHEPQGRNLLDAGEWIRSHEDAILGTTYWSTAQHSGPFRYVIKLTIFFIHHVGQPASHATVSDPVPWLDGDVVTVVGESQAGAVVNASRNGNGEVVPNLTDDMINGKKYVWTFKITYTTG